jgi:hypothetical protein
MKTSISQKGSLFQQRLLLLVIVASMMHTARAFVTSTSRICQRQSVSRMFSSALGDLDELKQKIQVKGEEIRQLKADGVEKSALGPHIEELLALKAKMPEEGKESKPKAKEQPQKKKAPAPAPKMEEMSASELRLNRLSKVEAMRNAGVEPFEYSFAASHKAVDLLALYDGKLEPGEEDEEVIVAVAGRIMTRRVFGKLAFFTLQDDSGTIQLQFDKNRLGDTFKVSSQSIVCSCRSVLC